ncbi:MAG: hypothetical protein NTU53_11995 [Planctomycetota bacterium]|nr:hypothetical protein [Planctomycetota bacterium]
MASLEACRVSYWRRFGARENIEATAEIVFGRQCIERNQGT